MSDRYDNDDFDDDQDHSPAGLRKALEKAKREAKEANARADKAEAEKADALKTVKKSTLKDILEKKGVKPGLTRFLEQDNVEATAEAVEAWLQENGEFFNVKANAPKDEAGDEVVDDAGDEDVIDPELAAALEASQRLDQSGVSPSQVGTMQRIKALPTDPSKASWEDLVNGLKEAGAPLV